MAGRTRRSRSVLERGLMTTNITPEQAKEEWRSIPGWDGFYEVSDHGGIRSVERVVVKVDGRVTRYKGRPIKQRTDDFGYKHAQLLKRGKAKQMRVHRAVLLAFVGEPPNENDVCRHLDGNTSNNRLENLAWGTQRDNMLDMVAHGRSEKAKRTHCPRGHELSPPNLVPSKLPHRNCLACSRAQSRTWSYPLLKPKFQEIADSYYARLVSDPEVVE